MISNYSFSSEQTDKQGIFIPNSTEITKQEIKPWKQFDSFRPSVPDRNSKRTLL